MKKTFILIAAVLAAAAAVVAQAAGVPVLHYLQQPDVAIGLSGLGLAGITSYVQQRLELVKGHIQSLPANLKPGPRSPYA